MHRVFNGSFIILQRIYPLQLETMYASVLLLSSTSPCEKQRDNYPAVLFNALVMMTIALSTAIPVRGKDGGRDINVESGKKTSLLC
jgi:hypothetical protein